MIEYAIRIPRDNSPNPAYDLYPVPANYNRDQAVQYAEQCGAGVILVQREMPDWVPVK